jgi:hypothetical protein
LHKVFLQQPFFAETTASPPVRGSLFLPGVEAFPALLSPDKLTIDFVLFFR